MAISDIRDLRIGNCLAGAEVLTLEEYLDGECRTVADDIKSLEATLQKAAFTLETTFRRMADGGGYWDYEQRLDGDVEAEHVPLDKISQGTVAMVAAAVGKLTGQCTLHDGRAARLQIDSGNLRDSWATAVETLTRSIEHHRNVFSGSFGTNDPITLGHIAELLRGVGTLEEESIAKLRKLMASKSVIDSVEDLATRSPTQNDQMLPKLSQGKEYLKGSFATVRVVRNLIVFKEEINEYKKIDLHSGYQKFFESSLHNHLSYSSILDSRFDPAELMSALEGLLLCRPQVVDVDLFARVLDVLEQKQQESAHWRPTQPVYANSRGETMLPISVEGVNSLLRSFTLLSTRREFAAFAGKCTAMMQRFWHWLQARSVETESIFGWHSEHVNDLNLIHIWDTSQVVEFMLDYRALLQRHIAHQTLTLSRVKVDRPGSLTKQLDTSGEVSWSTVVKMREPVRTLGRAYRIFERAGTDFVEPWLEKRPENYSMLVYGPPGTGKTALAKLIAGALGFPLISITVSDFLASGGASVEARAKAIFQMLEAQSDCVILFDEIDSFLLDRDSTHYREQDTLFQFLTPGMLTKIHDLRSAKKSIFIIATNYENRIDPAIKRTGRIDRKYLLLPPDADRRLELAEQQGLSPKVERSEVAKHSLYLGYGDIKASLSKARRESRGAVEELCRAERSTGGEFYGRRAYIDDPFPLEEAACLYLLAKEVGLVSNSESDGPDKLKGFKEHFSDGENRAAMGAKREPPPEELETNLWDSVQKRAEEITGAAER